MNRRPDPGWPAAAVVRRCLVTDSPLVTSHLEAAVADRRAGAVVCFVGTVRDHDAGRPVTALRYEAHPDAERLLADRLTGFVATQPQVLALAVAHRYGDLDVGDVACVVAVSAAHRAAAFSACAALLELVKTEAPVWKHQSYADGPGQWVGLPLVAGLPERAGLP
ncbi:MAG: molybdenum cofactor biosynthesis protein MoaE [Micrococcales bacterium]|nr:molybdenum cofactor biosynthesis protein MoaE [Micrococcales bacterium]